MTPRLKQHVSWPVSLGTIITTLVIAMLTAGGRLYGQSKLDTSRFVADSITSHFETREILARLARLDSTTRQSAADISDVRSILVCGRTGSRCGR